MSGPLRDLYFFRAAASTLWVTLVSTVDASNHPGATVSILAGLLLVAYPTSDMIATVIHLHADNNTDRDSPGAPT